MRLIDGSIRRPVTVFMTTLGVVIFGLVAASRLDVDLLPDISYPSLTVRTDLPDAAPGDVEQFVTRPVEEGVGVVPGLVRIHSVSRPGQSEVTLEFASGTRMDLASLSVREKLDLVGLPREAKRPAVLRFDPSLDPIMRLRLSGGGNLQRLRRIAEHTVKSDLEGAPGVAAVKVVGGEEQEIGVDVDAGRLSAVGLTLADVSRRLAEENINLAGGSLTEGQSEYLIRATNQFIDPEEIGRVILAARPEGIVRLSDVAVVGRTAKDREVVARLDGEEAVEVSIYKEGDANTVAVARAVTRRLERVGKELPAGVKVVTGVDQSRFIQASIDEVIGEAIVGGILAMLVLLLFLKDLTSTMIIGLSIPISIIATFFLMYQTGTTLNVMSLGGLALGVGMLVDNAIVVMEAIFQHRERGESPLAAALAGTQEVGKAVVAATLTTVVVFVPVVFVEGIAAQIFRDQALTVSFSLMASLVVSLTLIPLMTVVVGAGPRTAVATTAHATDPVPAGTRLASLRRAGRWTVNRAPVAGLYGVRRAGAWILTVFAFVARPLTRVFDRALATLLRSYPPVLRWALTHRGTVLAVAFLAFVVSLAVVPRLGVDLVPQFSQGEFSFQVELPEGTPLEVTDRFMSEVQTVLGDDPRIESFSSITGGAALSLTRTGSEGENVGRIQVRMKAGTRAGEEESVAAKLRQRLELGGQARFKFERPTYFTFRTPIEVEIYSDSIEDLDHASTRVRGALAGIPGLVDVKSTLEMGSPELQITFNRERLAALGLDLFQVATTVRNKVQGEVATRFLEGDRQIDILVRSVEVGTASIADVQDMIIGQRAGVPIFMKSVADIRLARGPSEIRRIGQNRAALVSGNLQGRDMGAAAADVRAALQKSSLPAGVTAGLSGQEEEMQRSFRSLMLALTLALFLVYMVMACEFESLLHPFVVMFTVPLGTVGAVAALALTGNSINVVAIIGALLLAGIVVDNAIVLIDAVNQLREQGRSREGALLEGGMLRMRPILMTSATTILGLVPMALGLGEGGELQSPMAITVIGGLGLGTILTLIVIPVVYVLLDRKEYVTATVSSPAAGSPPRAAEPARGQAGFFPGALPDPVLTMEEGRAPRP